MKIYVAAPWQHKEDARHVGQLLRELGHVVTSRWFDHEGDPNDSTGAKSPLTSIQHQALQDIDDVTSADLLIVLNLAKSEGKAVETGIALANSIPVISIGTRSNIFQSLATEVPDLDSAFDHLRTLTAPLSRA